MDLWSSVETVQLPLFESELYVEVKRELSAGDEKKLTFGALTRTRPERDSNDDYQPVYDVDTDKVAFLKLSLWIVDWNLPDKHTKKPVPIDTPRKKMDALKALRSEVLAEIERVVDAHAKEAQEKKVPSPSAA